MQPRFYRLLLQAKEIRCFLDAHPLRPRRKCPNLVKGFEMRKGVDTGLLENVSASLSLEASAEH